LVVLPVTTVSYRQLHLKKKPGREVVLSVAEPVTTCTIDEQATYQLMKEVQ